MKKTTLFFASLCFLLTAYCQNTTVTIPGSQVKTFTSTIVKNQPYALQVSLPASYAKSNQKYPVVYLMDSQWDFPLVTALYGQQYFDGFIPEVIIVGITWGGDHPNPDSLAGKRLYAYYRKEVAAKWRCRCVSFRYQKRSVSHCR